MNSRTLFGSIGALLVLASLAFGWEEPATVVSSAEVRPAAFSKLDQYLQDAVDDEALAGAVALVEQAGHTVYQASIGFADRESGTPMSTDAIFRIASMSKPITTVGALVLYEDGRFELDDPISKFIPEFSDPKVLVDFNANDTTFTTRPASREITIRDLLTHTSGIGYGLFDERLRAIYGKAGIPDITTERDLELEDAITALGKLPLLHDPGAQWTYGLSDDVLGYLIEVISGQPLDQFLRIHVFQPLRMFDTYFYLPDRKADRLAALYCETETGLVRYDDRRIRELVGLDSPDYPLEGAKSYFSGGGGLNSTVYDVARFARMLLNGGELDGVRLLSDETVALMTSNQIGELDIEWYTEYGFGFGGWAATVQLENASQVGSFGWDGLWNTTFWIDPASELVVVLLSQTFPTSCELWKIQPLVYQGLDALGGQADRAQPASASLPHEHLIGNGLVVEAGADAVFRMLD